MPYEPMTIRRLSELIASPADTTHRLRLVYEFYEEYRHEGRPVRAALIGDSPCSIDRRWDALIAALAEHLAFHDDLPAPVWLREPAVTLEPWWFPIDHPGYRALALATSPISFRRRGVFVPADIFEAA